MEAFRDCGRQRSLNKKLYLYLLKPQMVLAEQRVLKSMGFGGKEASWWGKVMEKREEEFTIHPLAPEHQVDTLWAVAKRPHISESLSMSGSLGLVHPPLSPGAAALDTPYVAASMQTGLELSSYAVWRLMLVSILYTFKPGDRRLYRSKKVVSDLISHLKQSVFNCRAINYSC